VLVGQRLIINQTTKKSCWSILKKFCQIARYFADVKLNKKQVSRRIVEKTIKLDFKLALRKKQYGNIKDEVALNIKRIVLKIINHSATQLEERSE
jgi:hypothetical protein